MKINVELVTPEKLFFSQDADMIVVPGAEGDFGVLPNHSPMISTIRPGVVKLENDGKSEKVFVSGGFAEVTGERCTIIAEEAQDANSLSDEKIEKLVQEAANQ